MSRVEHYRKAEEILADLPPMEGGFNRGSRELRLAEAQVHAILASVPVTSVEKRMSDGSWQTDWQEESR